MSALNSNSDDRELEAIRRAQRAHEPSMEEILASIRNIIAEEHEPATPAAPKPAQPAPALASAPQIVYSKDAPAPRPESPQRADAGAPTVGWAMFAHDALKIEKGAARIYRSSEHGRRHFCPECGTGLFYTNEQALPGIIDVQSATLDDPKAFAPAVQIQIADRIGWMARAHELPAFDRYPPQP